LFVERGPNLYSFIHVSLQEYFASEALSHQPNFVQDAINLWQKDRQNWREVILFAVDSLSQTKQDLVSQLIQGLLATHEARSIIFAGECLLSADIQLKKTSLTAEVINALIMLEVIENIEPLIQEQIKKLKQTLQNELDAFDVIKNDKK
jgi:hypothetical protein